MAKIRFPHFTLEEAEVLEEFIKQHRNFYNWKFDVRLTSRKAEEVKIADPTMRMMWKALTAKRIDAVAETDTFIHIIEVKRVMLSSGIGQLLVYSYMYNEQFKPNKNIKLWLIAKYPDPDVEHICKQLGISTWVMYR